MRLTKQVSVTTCSKKSTSNLALAYTLEGRMTAEGVLPEILSPGTLDLLKTVEAVQIVTAEPVILPVV